MRGDREDYLRHIFNSYAHKHTIYRDGNSKQHCCEKIVLFIFF
jgi:hypothetical protein